MNNTVMNKNQSNEILSTIGQIADERRLKVYAVGGYVRDLLLDIIVQDIDFVVLGDGPTFAKFVAKRLNSKELTVYKKFGTAMVKHQDVVLEFVSARSESYRGDSRKPVVESADLLTDLTRRDFTINAIAMSINKESYGDIFDPFGGRDDLHARILKTPCEPRITFYDDPLRIMRAIRFASTLGFEIEHLTKKALGETKSRLTIISQERITDELVKIIMSPKPSIGFAIMAETNVLEMILPEIADLKRVDHVGKYRHKNIFEHTLKVLDNVSAVSNKLNLRFAALFHDIAKPATKEFKSGLGWTFHGHEDLGAKMSLQTGKRLKLSNEIMNYIEKLVRLHLRPIFLAEEGVTDSAIRRLIFLAGDDIDDLIALCRADITSGNPIRVKKHLANFDHVVKRIAEVEAKDKLRHFQPPVRGEEIMAVLDLTPGPMIGKIKTAIEEAILNGDIPNEHDAAFQYMLQIKDQYLKG
jgi:poly(A) polymerase